MVTSIQISENLQQALAKKKIFSRETYEEVIWDLIEDTKELNEETKKELVALRAEARKGKVHTLAEIKKEAGL